MRTFRIRLQKHVGFINRLSADNERSIKHHTISKHPFVNKTRIHGHIMKLPPWISITQIHKTNVIILNMLKDITYGRHRYFPLKTTDRIKEKRRTVQLISDSIHPGFTSAYPDDFLNRGNKNLAIANASSLGRLADCFNNCINSIIADNDINLDLR